MQRPYLNEKLLTFFVFVKKEVNRKTAMDIGVEGDSGEERVFSHKPERFMREIERAP